VEGSDVCLIFKVLSRNLPGGTEEKHAKRQDGQSSGRDLNPVPPECEAGTLTT
jgi:hypothetical protein